jgi:hypothetical protein
VTVTAVNDPQIAANDSYSVLAGQTLIVSAATGVLQNDTDVDSVGLTAVPGQGPLHGSLTLLSDGGFTYIPAGSFAGTDTFTYHASDGDKTSSLTTVSVTVTAVDCTPRPRVVSRPVVGSGKLNVHVTSTALNTQQSNPLRRIVWTTPG